MAQLPSSFNRKGHKGMDDFSALPKDEYLAQIIKSEMKKTKDGEGQYLNLLFKVLHGKFKGRTFFVMLNIINKNDQTVEIAGRQLKTISEAAGLPDIPEDSAELHGIPMIVKTDVQEATANYAEKTIAKMYTKFDGDIPSKTEVEPEHDEKAAASGGKKRPWD